MQLDILTPEAEVFSGEVDYVQLPGIDGLFEVLNNHAPLISALQDGKLKLRANGKVQDYVIKSGIVEVINNKVSVLTEGVIAQ